MGSNQLQKVAVITGAASGIGRACAEEFLKRGYRVAVMDIIPSDLRDVLYLKVDVSNQDEVDAAIAEVEASCGGLDVVVNNAGVCSNIPFLEMTKEQYDNVVQTNQYGTFYVMQAAARVMVSNKTSGVIINMSSIFSEVASLGVIHYHASKAAVSMMTKSAALELAPYGIRVVGVAPGIIDTPMLQRDKEQGMWEVLQQKHMRGRALQPSEVASVVAFLASDAASGMNGTVIPIEDGLLSKY
jgi:glucose 1-dehydrogenase